MISAETRLPSAAPLRWTLPLKLPKRLSAGSVRVPAWLAALLSSPYAITPTVAVTRPERSIDHCNWLTRQPGYMA